MSITASDTQAFEARFAPASVAADAFADDNDIVLFVHIPKTAGMSVGKTLRNAFDTFRPVAWEEVGKSFRANTRDALYWRTVNTGRQVLMGHFGWPEIQFWRNHELPIKCATIIRDPLDRLVSNYNYNCSAKHPNSKQFQRKFPTMEDYAKTLGYDYQLTRMVGLTYSFDEALEKMARYYSFIGVTEHLGDSLAHLRASHGFKMNLREHRENVGAKGKAKTEVSDAVRNMVLEVSQNDMRLHKLIMSYYA